ncbi:hypothetical protein AF335_22070 [Streptomyces eurocidicus]|uniref:Uncharacterized protein n=1 Tax=Streptomyces eurocidicus TaxID=66423 RepID=A0A2N8NS32_STREU|nr:hypothetical protein [Streptomyces eurocidicus]MBB5122850.1 hypothetical protein [Streptomyces eurocidicus]MBF6054308.1 hypothetical protein [Streptomyces eurocidicus]PNE31568.1 hypothetical protein AF335_22070 [Streptomyces eurocidicus]
MPHAAHRPSLRDSRRRAGRLAAAAALSLSAVALATPAHAASSCEVNGVTQMGPAINGTAGADDIVCSSVDAVTVVDSMGGDDTFILTGPVDGRIRMGDGNDRVALESTAELTDRGEIDGQGDQDGFDISGKVLGAVRGGQDKDRILVYKGATMGSRTDLRGAKGDDVIDVESSVVVQGLVEGNEDNDDIRVGDNEGTVDGGPGTDHCVVLSGNLPDNCES